MWGACEAVGVWVWSRVGCVRGCGCMCGLWVDCAHVGVRLPCLLSAIWLSPAPPQAGGGRRGLALPAWLSTCCKGQKSSCRWLAATEAPEEGRWGREPSLASPALLAYICPVQLLPGLCWLLLLLLRARALSLLSLSCLPSGAAPSARCSCCHFPPPVCCCLPVRTLSSQAPSRPTPSAPLPSTHASPPSTRGPE